jgi:hypothetical protein
MTQATDILSSVVTAHIANQEENGEPVPITVVSHVPCILTKIHKVANQINRDTSLRKPQNHQKHDQKLSYSINQQAQENNHLRISL